MITIKKGNIFTTRCQTIVNTVNCVGVMGAGIAYEFKLRHPQMFRAYEAFCKNGQIKVGTLWIYSPQEQPKYCSKILNFPTKNHWKDPSTIEFLELGLQKFLGTYKQKGITSIAFPLLGASLGGLSESEVLKTMEFYLNQTDIDIEIWHFDSNAKDDLFDDFKNKFTSLNNENIKKHSGLRSTAIEKIKSALNQSDINSISSLLSVKGIGKVSLEKAFDFTRIQPHSPEVGTLI